MRRLAIGAGVGVVAALALAPATADALQQLRVAREARAAIEAMIQRPAPAVPSERMVSVDALAQQVRRMAGGAGVLVEAAAPVEGGPLARVQLRLSGSEAAVLGLADRLERGTPTVRFTRWRVEGAGASVRLTGEVAAP